MTKRKLTKGLDILIRIKARPRMTRFEKAVDNRRSLKEPEFFLLYLPVIEEINNHKTRKETVDLSAAVTISKVLYFRKIKK